MSATGPEGGGGGGARDLVHLASAVVASLVSGIYVIAYNAAMTAVQMPCDFSEDRLQIMPTVTRLCAEADLLWLAVPVAALGLGLWLRRRARPTLFAAVVSITWLLSFAWVLLAHLAWLLPMVPLCSPVRP